MQEPLRITREEQLAQYRRWDNIIALRNALCLFCRIVWRRGDGGRIDTKTAWRVAWIVWNDYPDTQAAERAYARRYGDHRNWSTYINFGFYEGLRGGKEASDAQQNS